MALERYRLVASGRKLPTNARTARRRLPIDSFGAATDAELWQLHDSMSRQTGRKPGRSGQSLLDLKIELAGRMLGSCRLCERECGVNRTAGETGFCGVGVDTHCFFEQILWGEEAPLVPSHEVFFSGCNMRCSYCYSWEAVMNASQGREVTTQDLAKIIDCRRLEGADNLNLIGGEPTIQLPNILSSLKLIKTRPPVVWNSNFYMTRETMALLDGVVDLYLGDLRFGNDQCASEIAATDRYFEIACRNFRIAVDSADVIIRHLVMPGHVQCCLRPIAEWVAEALPNVPFSLMFQYAPFFRALDDPLLCRSLTPEEEAEAVRIVSSLGLNTRWNKRTGTRGGPSGIGSGRITTTVIVRPDGKVAVMHLHEDLVKITQALTNEGETV